MAGIIHHKDLTGVDLHVTKLHAATHLVGGTDPLGLGTASIADVPATGDASAIQVVLGDDSRLSDARTPSIHAHGEGDVTDLVTDLAAKIPKSLLTEQGDIIYATAVATPAALPHGIVGQVLQSGGHGANPSWLTLGTMAAAVASDYVPKSLFDAYSVLYADTDDTPARLTVGASTVVGRAATGGIVALAKSDLLTLLNVADGATNYAHPTTNGNIHVPASGASTQLLQYSSAGTAKWITFSSDLTVADGGAITIAAKAITLAKMNDMATGSLIYRKTAGAGVPEVNTLATLKTDLGLGTMAVETATDYLAKAIVTAKGDVIAASANATPVHLAVGTDGQVLTADTASAAGVKWGNAGAGTVTAITGTFPIVSSGGLTPAISLSDAGVTYAKMQNISATDKLLGRVTAGAGSPEEIACTAAGRAILDDANSAAQLVTLGAASADITTLFLTALARHGVLTNLITNGAFETDVAGWGGTNATLSQETAVPLVGAGSLKILAAGNGDSYAVLAVTTIVGHVYMMTCLAKSTAAAGRLIRIQSSEGGISKDCSAGITQISFTFTATGTSNYCLLDIMSALANEYILADSVACYDLSA